MMLLNTTLFTWFLVKNKLLHKLYIVVEFYKAHCPEKHGVLWLASNQVHCYWPGYLKCVKEKSRPLPYLEHQLPKQQWQVIMSVIKLSIRSRIWSGKCRWPSWSDSVSDW